MKDTIAIASKLVDPVTSSISGSCSVVFIVFLILKLTSVIAWSWWWVTAPIWGGFAINIIILTIMIIILKILEKH